MRNRTQLHRRIYLANTHSVLNSGDAAIALAQIELLREILPGARIALTSRTPALDESLYGRLGVDVLPPLLPARGLPAGRRSRRDSFRALRRSDLVIAGGGGYFWSNRASLPGPVFLQNAAPLLLARRFGKPVIFFPQSFGPLFNRAAAGLVKGCLNGGCVRRILAREESSLDFVRALLGPSPNAARAALCPDMAFLLDRAEAAPERPAASDPPRPVLAVTVRRWDYPGSGGRARAADRDRAYRTAVVETIRGFIERHGGSVLLFAQSRGPWAFEDDRPITAAVAAALRAELPPGRVIVPRLADDADPRDLIGLLGGADALLATRFHSAILGLTAGLLPVVLGYQPKSAGMMRLLGLEDRVLPIEDVDPERAIELAGAAMAESGRDKAVRRARLDALRSTVRAEARAALEPWREGGRP